LIDAVEIDRLNWDERAAIHARDVDGFYRLDRFREGEDSLFQIESGELGDVASWARNIALGRFPLSMSIRASKGS